MWLVELVILGLFMLITKSNKNTILGLFVLPYVPTLHYPMITPILLYPKPLSFLALIPILSSSPYPIIPYLRPLSYPTLASPILP